MTRWECKKCENAAVRDPCRYLSRKLTPCLTLSDYKMKITISPLLLLPAAVSALSCGGPLTKACLGETDKRCNFKASNALKDQAPVWGTLDGFFRCEQRYYDGATGLPIIGFNIPVRGPKYQRFPRLLVQ
jgi:hypothetical protein